MTRRPVVSTATWPAIIALSLAANAVFFGSLAGREWTHAEGKPIHAGGGAAAAAEKPLHPSCVGDALLAASAGTLWCAGPGAERDCYAALEARLRADVDECHGKAEVSPVAVALLDPGVVDRIPPIDPEPLLEMLREVPDAPKPPALPPPAADTSATPPPPPPRQLDQQVIETVKPEKLVEPPTNTRFLSEFNTVVDKQTVARGAKAEELIEKPKPQELMAKPTAQDPSAAKPPSERPPGLDERAPDQPGKLAMRPPGATAPSEKALEQVTKGTVGGSTAPPGDGAAPQRGTGSISQDRRDAANEPRGEGGGGGGAPRVPDLRSPRALERVVGGGSVDHVEDVEEGETNAFNSREDMAANFFNRVKRQVAREWEPGRLWLARDPSGQKYGFKSRLTVLRVVLSPDGRLVSTTIRKASGVDFLDDEAIRAFSVAGPFPNPPPLLREGGGNVTFTFGFHFELGRKKDIERWF